MNIRFYVPLVAAALTLVCGTARATLYNYAGTVSLCTGTCDSISSFTLGSQVLGYITIDTSPNGSFSFDDVGEYSFQIIDLGILIEPFDGTNAATANPLPIVPSVASVEATGGGLTTGGTTDSFGNLASGALLFRFIVAPFDSNDTWIIIDLASGNGQMCLSYTAAGCIPAATQIGAFDGQFSAVDSDGDGIENFEDNCIAVANLPQKDTNLDGIGNACDADINNDCSVNFADLAALRAAFTPRPYNPDADFDGDGNVNFGDLAFMKASFFNGENPGPGPSGLPNACTPLTIVTEDFGDGGFTSAGGWSAGFGGSVVAGGGEDGAQDHAMMYSTGNLPGLNGFHLLHPTGGAEPNPLFQGDYPSALISDISFRARHSGTGDTVVLRAVLFDDFGDGTDWAQTIASVTIPDTATSWQTYTLSLRPGDLTPGGQNGVPVVDILTDVEQIGLRHDPLGTGPGNPSPVSSPTIVWFDDISLQAGGAAR